MPDPLFQGLFTDTEQLRPAPVTQVQARGRQRTRRQRLSIMAATLVMVVPAGAAFAVRQGGDHDGAPTVVATEPSAQPSSATPSAGPIPTRPGRSTQPPTGPTSPSSAQPGKNLTSVPTAALLRADDLGGSGWKTDDGVEGDWSLAATLGYCRNSQGLEHYGDPEDKRLRSINRGQARSGVIQEVLLFGADGAQKYYDYYRRGAAVCRQHVSDLGGADVRVTIVAQGFAGRSLLIRTSSESGTGLYGVVVHGNLASQFAVLDGSEATGRQLAAKARDRLCQAVDTC